MSRVQAQKGLPQKFSNVIPRYRVKVGSARLRVMGSGHGRLDHHFVVLLLVLLAKLKTHLYSEVQKFGVKTLASLLTFEETLQTNVTLTGASAPTGLAASTGSARTASTFLARRHSGPCS